MSDAFLTHDRNIRQKYKIKSKKPYTESEFSFKRFKRNRNRKRANELVISDLIPSRECVAELMK